METAFPSPAEAGQTPRAVVIAGAGQAGFQLAASLRQEGFGGRVVLIGDEPGLPYQRPPLSKAYLADGDAGRLALRPHDFFAEHGITLIAGAGVLRIDRAARKVALDDGRSLAFDHLVLALGARNRVLPLPGADLPNVVGLRTLADAGRLRALLADATSLAVIGGGLIGLEVAAVARKAGLDVTVAEAGERLMGRTVSARTAARLQSWHEAQGTRIRLNAGVRAIRPGPAGLAAGLELADGTGLAADLVLVAAGVVPNQELAAQAGLAVGDGILVDAMLSTSDPAISAIGDCACFRGGVDGRPVRLESVQNAVDQARSVAARLLGRAEPYHKVPWFWSDQGPNKLQIAGLAAGCDRFVERPMPGGAFALYGFRGDRLQAVESINAPADHMAARRLLALPAPPALADLQRIDFDPRRAVAEFAG